MKLPGWLADLLRRRRPRPPPDPSDAVAAALLIAHNAVRAARGRRALSIDPRLCAAARAHAARMAEVSWLASTGLGDGDPWSRMRAAGVEFSLASENVAVGHPDAESVIRSWLSDPLHAANVLGDWSIAGFGCVGYYWCADYARL